MVSGVISYTNQRVGVNSLKNILPEQSKKSAITVQYTYHSLLATAITRVLHAEVKEKVIAETSGQRSLKALRSYERTSQQQQQNVSSMIKTTIEKEQDNE